LWIWSNYHVSAEKIRNQHKEGMQEQKGITLLSEENHRRRCQRKTTVTVAGGERRFDGGVVDIRRRWSRYSMEAK
jgi:hypothetical protein